MPLQVLNAWPSLARFLNPLDRAPGGKFGPLRHCFLNVEARRAVVFVLGAESSPKGPQRCGAAENYRYSSKGPDSPAPSSKVL
jgi:hypothetical protein